MSISGSPERRMGRAGPRGRSQPLSDIEIRPLYESEDFGPEVAAQENELRAKIAKGTKG